MVATPPEGGVGDEAERGPVKVARGLDSNRVIGVDLGGTKVLAGVVERDGTVLRHRETPTPLDSQEALLDGLEAAVKALQDDSIAAVGFGIPTRVEQETGRIVGESVNIPLKGMSF